MNNKITLPAILYSPSSPPSGFGGPKDSRPWLLIFMEAKGSGELKERERSGHPNWESCWRFAWERALTIASESGYYNHVHVLAETERLPGGGEAVFSLVQLLPVGYAVSILGRGGNQITRQELPHMPIAEVRRRAQEILDAVTDAMRAERGEGKLSVSRPWGRIEVLMENGDPMIVDDTIRPSL